MIISQSGRFIITPDFLFCNAGSEWWFSPYLAGSELPLIFCSVMQGQVMILSLSGRFRITPDFLFCNAGSVWWIKWHLWQKTCWRRVQASETKQTFTRQLDFSMKLVCSLILTLCILGNFRAFSAIFLFKINFSKKIFQKYHQSVKQFESRSGLTFCPAWSVSKLFAKVISRRH